MEGGGERRRVEEEERKVEEVEGRGCGKDSEGGHRYVERRAEQSRGGGERREEKYLICFIHDDKTSIFERNVTSKLCEYLSHDMKQNMKREREKEEGGDSRRE